MNIFERLRNIRKYRGFTQEDVAKWFDLSGASYGRKEKGKEGGLGPAEIEVILKRTQMDPRYLFGLTDSLEEADLRINKRSDYGSLEKAIVSLQDKVKPIESLDEATNRVRINEPLHDVVELIYKEDGSVLKEIKAMIYGYFYKTQPTLQIREDLLKKASETK